MGIETVRDVLLWCTAINYSLLLLWAFVLPLAHDPIGRLCGRVFRVSVEQVDAINYAGIVAFKLCIVFFNLVPYIALRLAGPTS